jgi:hypothetical protein
MGRMKYAAAAMPGETHSSRSVSVRKIDNGYVVSETTCSNGDYKSTERYCETAPDIEAEEAHGPDAGRENLRGAMKELHRTK